MRNLKRALSLALASVMLLGMMVVGSSAAFADADQIVNTEAVEITAGLKIFEGSDGKFNPTGTVTRAQMATVIVKMLYGSEVNADQFKGIKKFNDTVAFEGGWAEGYINWCANLGVVSGYGDGSFKPGQAVTTAEAVTMIINALGVDAGKGEWPLTVMAKAEEMDLFDELAVKPGTNVALTRDQLASIVLEGLKYSPEGVQGYTVDDVANIIFTDMADALAAAKNDANKIKEVVGEDALYRKVFDVQSKTGYITANQANGDEYTTVSVYDWDKGEVVTYELDIETGLDMIGHYVTAYFVDEYKSEVEPGKAYCIVDEAEYVTVDKPEVDSYKEYKEFFSKATKVAANGVTVSGNYFVTAGMALTDGALSYSETAWTAPQGTYVIYEGKINGFINSASSSASKVVKVTTTAGKESITFAAGVGLKYNTEDLDEIVEYDGIAKNDIVIVKNAQNRVWSATKAELVTGKITKTSTDEYGRPTITINGNTYVAYKAGKEDSVALGGSGLNRSAVDFTETYDVYVTGNKYIGWKTAASAANVDDVVYVLGTYDVLTSDSYGNDVTYYYAQGVDMAGKEVTKLVGIDYAVNTADIVDMGEDSERAIGEYMIFEESNDKDWKKAGILEMKALKGAFDKDDPTIYTGTNNSGALKTDTAKVNTVAGELAFITANTKFIIVDGGLGEKLETAVVTGGIRKDATNAKMILSQDDNGAVTMEVMVIFGDVSIVSDDFIFVSDAQAAAGATIGKKEMEYEVFFTKTGEKKTISIEATKALGGQGFYSYEYDANEDIYKLTELTDTDEAMDHGWLQAGEIFSTANGTKLVSTTIKGVDAADAKIFDVRSAKELDQSDVPAIETLQDMLDATNADYEITFSAVLDDDYYADNFDAEKITMIFVTDIVYKG